MKTWLYFVQENSTRYIKIGVSKSLKKRLRSLQCGNPHKLTVLAVVIGTEAMERELHERFAAHRVLGEWFKPTRPLIEVIRKLKKGATAVPTHIAKTCTFAGKLAVHADKASFRVVQAEKRRLQND